MSNMAEMSWDDLYQERLKNRGNLGAQEEIAPFEHRAWAREKVNENPLNALAYTVLPLGYQAKKVLGIGEKDDMSTGPSMNQLVESYKGVGEGLANNFNKLASWFR